MIYEMVYRAELISVPNDLQSNIRHTRVLKLVKSRGDECRVV